MEIKLDEFGEEIKSETKKQNIDFKKTEKYKTIERAKSYAFHLLAKRDYISEELKSKLLSKNYSLKTAQEVVDFMQEKGFLDDLRTAQNLIDFYKDKKGENWIKQKLMQKGVNNFEDLDFENKDFSNIIRNTISKYKLKNSQDLDVNTRAKIYRFLMGRGYKNVSNIVRQIEEKLK